DAADRALPVDDRVAGLLSNRFEQPVQPLIIERACEHANRLDAAGVRDRVQLPEAEVAGEEQHALALRVGVTRALLAVELDAVEHRLARSRAELQQLEQQPPEMLERPPRDRAPLGLGAGGERDREISLGDS